MHSHFMLLSSNQIREGAPDISVCCSEERAEPKAKSVYWLIFATTLICGRTLSVTESMKSQIQVTKMSFVCRMAGLSYR